MNAPPFDAKPVSGLNVAIGGRPLVMVFVRSLSGSLARLALASLQARFARFDAAGIGVVAITRCDLTLARDYVPRHHLLFPLVVDGDGRWFEAYGVGRDRGFGRSLLGLRPARVQALVRALALGRGRPDGGADQLPAEFVVGADATLRHARIGPTILDQPDIEALWAAATS